MSDNKKKEDVSAVGEPVSSSRETESQKTGNADVASTTPPSPNTQSGVAAQGPNGLTGSKQTLIGMAVPALPDDNGDDGDWTTCEMPAEIRNAAINRTLIESENEPTNPSHSETETVTPEIEQHLKAFFKIGQENPAEGNPSLDAPRSLLTNELVEAFNYGMLSGGIKLDAPFGLDEPDNAAASDALPADDSERDSIPDPDFGNLDNIQVPTTATDEATTNDRVYDTEEKTTVSLSEDFLEQALRSAESGRDQAANDDAAESATTDADTTAEHPQVIDGDDAVEVVIDDASFEGSTIENGRTEEENPSTETAARGCTLEETSNAADTSADSNAAEVSSAFGEEQDENVISGEIENADDDDTFDAPDNRPTLPSKRTGEYIADAIKSSFQGADRAAAKSVNSDSQNNPKPADTGTMTNTGAAPKKTGTQKVIGFALAAAALLTIGFMIFRNSDSSRHAPATTDEVTISTSALTVKRAEEKYPKSAAGTSDRGSRDNNSARPVAPPVALSATTHADTKAVAASPMADAATNETNLSPVPKPGPTRVTSDTTTQAEKRQSEPAPTESNNGTTKHKLTKVAADSNPSRPVTPNNTSAAPVAASMHPSASHITDDVITFTARFKTGTAIFSFMDKADQRAFMQDVRKKTANRNILIQGYVTQEEKDQHMGRIAISRAWAVQKFLQNHGIDSTRITARRGNLKDREKLPTDRDAVVTVSILEKDSAAD
ncbi:MAG: hypothetical protein JXX14_17945 [Deltaproteobacteria bacterium]|nr:hypothetical protein [Deltaproteobacteria bacterium]